MTREEIKAVFGYSLPVTEGKPLSSAQRKVKSGFAKLAKMLGRALISMAATWVSKRYPGVPLFAPGASDRPDAHSPEQPGVRHSFPRDDLQRQQGPD